MKDKNINKVYKVNMDNGTIRYTDAKYDVDVTLLFSKTVDNQDAFIAELRKQTIKNIEMSESNGL